MKLCHSIQDIIEMWPYSQSKPPVRNFPKSYPVLAEFVDQAGGIGGDYYSLEVIRIPKGYTEEQMAAFLAGVKAESKTLGIF